MAFSMAPPPQQGARARPPLDGRAVRDAALRFMADLLRAPAQFPDFAAALGSDAGERERLGVGAGGRWHVGAAQVILPHAAPVEDEVDQLHPALVQTRLLQSRHHVRIVPVSDFHRTRWV